MVSKPKSSGHTKGVALMYRGGETESQRCISTSQVSLSSGLQWYVCSQYYTTLRCDQSRNHITYILYVDEYVFSLNHIKIIINTTTHQRQEFKYIGIIQINNRI